MSRGPGGIFTSLSALKHNMSVEKQPEHGYTRFSGACLPLDPLVKLNVDAGYLQNSKKVSLDCVIKDHNGQVLGTSCRITYSVQSIFAAEAIAFPHGLQFAQDMGFSCFIIEGDARTIVRRVQSTESNLSDIRSLVIYIKEKNEEFRECHFHFIPRHANQVAHALASKGLRESTDLFWVKDAPPSILSLAAADPRHLEPP
ncbi:hypothetical protein F3Y22_tig00113721pilonHSYRG00048 [Hibiscus syriacus]|uniref:RNase H type-1 domain-containing protein n=1 Tax=Hibiscus syriacus TaxID=106335 RepID=A0A6A2WP12_HIBSY|nr:uncharacterized protein LOC120186930 [Hibiscus syriacus]KAE8661988.1 hypothetical protein F3Y22_tig00113721pilonHSYRG00048 [Hibiscus syriacus]